MILLERDADFGADLLFERRGVERPAGEVLVHRFRESASVNSKFVSNRPDLWTLSINHGPTVPHRIGIVAGSAS